jgi:hypothetical protein
MKDGNPTILYTKETRLDPTTSDQSDDVAQHRSCRSESHASVGERRTLKRGQASLACQRSCLITQVITLPLSAPKACTAFVCGLLDRLELYGSFRAPLIVFALVLITFHKFPILVMTTLVMNLLLSANAVGRHPHCH